MRLWHKDLIHVLPRQQLVAQWRECCCIARNISVNGTPNHLLVNKVMDYPTEQFFRYGCRICNEMERRGYKANFNRFAKWFTKVNDIYGFDELFPDWHNERYLIQCYSNLQEKYDCGGIPQDEWKIIEDFMERRYENDNKRSRTNPRLKG